jgi:LCP family protein required for cell wall assembly
MSEETRTDSRQYLLALVRIVIGWHFLYEGLVKLLYPGWTSAGYLKSSVGPFAGFFHSLGSNDALVRIIDQLNIWSLLFIGAGLMLGFAARIASFGGMALLDKTIKKDLGVSIDGNIEVNFEGFTQLVDMLGGIDIDLNKAEAAHLNKKYGRKLAGGINHMDGQQTLEYARIRYVGKGDYERTDRQRTVLLQIFDSMMQLSLAKKYVMLNKMLPYLTTDMSKQEILGYAYAVLTHGVISTKSYRLPADGTFKSAKIRKMAVLVPNLTKNRALLKKYIYG